MNKIPSKYRLLLIIAFTIGISTISMGQQMPLISFADQKPVCYDFPTMNFMNSKKRKSEPWIVYSDRADNISYYRPNGRSKFKDISFLDCFYVIDQHGDFLEIVRYDQTLLSSPVLKRKVDRKKAEYMGWIHRSKVLEWSHSFTNPKDLSTDKYLTILKDVTGLTDWEKTLYGDSLIVFADPNFSKHYHSKTGLGKFVTLYKQSSDKQFSLIGTIDQFTPESIHKVIIGWIPSSYLQFWGNKLFIDPYKTSSNSIKLNDSSIISIISQDFWPLKKLPAEYQQLPVLSDLKTPNNKTATVLPTYLYNRSVRNTLNVLGNRVTFEDFKNIVTNSAKTNIIFVVDASNSVLAHVGELTNLFQNLSSEINDISSYNFGVLFYTSINEYGCSKGHQITYVKKLSADHNSTLKFLQTSAKKNLSCDQNSSQCALYTALSQSLDMLKDKSEENNLIVLIGTNGSGENIPASGVKFITEKIIKSNVRLLGFQVQNSSPSSYNEFVLQVQDLMNGSAPGILRNKKWRLINNDDIVEETAFKSYPSKGNLYLYDYPNHSMLQGGIIFPEKGKEASVADLKLAVDTLLAQIKFENDKTLDHLGKPFNQINSQNALFNPTVINNDSLTQTIKSSFKLPSRDLLYALKGFVSIDSTEAMIEKGILILNKDEYESLIAELTALNGIGQDSESNKFRRYMYHSLKEIYRLHSREKITRVAFNKTSLAEAFKAIISFPVQNELLKKYTLKNVKKSKKIPVNELLEITRLINNTVTVLQDNKTDNAFNSFGTTYYRITSNQLGSFIN